MGLRSARDAIRANEAAAATGGPSARSLEEQRRLMASDASNVALVRGSLDTLFTHTEQGDDFR